MASYYKAPTSNYWSTTLNGAINNSVQTITLTTTSGLQAPGVIVIDREDGAGNATSGSREIVSYTGISSNDLTGCTRGAENSTARAHSDGALVEAVFTIGQWNDLRDGVAAVLSTDGADVAVTGTASIATLDLDTFLTHPRLATTSVASIARVESAGAVLDGTSSLSQVFYKAGKGTLTTDTDGATITFDLDASNVHQVTLEDNRTLAISNEDAGQAFILRLIQDATGSRTVTWFSTIKWDNGTAPTLTTTANKTDVFGFICTGTDTYDGFIVGQNL
jgi:hypothetical protein